MQCFELVDFKKEKEEEKGSSYNSEAALSHLLAFQLPYKCKKHSNDPSI